MNIVTPEELDIFALHEVLRDPRVKKDNAPITLITCGGGLYAAKAWYRGIVSGGDGPHLAYAEKKLSRKLFAVDTLMRRGIGVIILRGHHDRPLTEIEVSASFAKMRNGVGCASCAIDGKAKLASPDGKAPLLEFLREHLLLHTITPASRVFYVSVTPDGDTGDRPIEMFTHELLAAFPPAVKTGPVVPAPVVRKNILLDSDRTKLRAAAPESMQPLVKIFGGACTWLCCHMEEDMDTMWGYADLGQSLVEYGSFSLKEIEEGRYSPLKLHFERDRHFDGKNIDYTTLLGRTSLAGI